MNLYLSNEHSDEDGDDPVSTGKLAMMYGSKTEILEVCEFFKAVEQYLKENDFCHMHLRDFLKNWNRQMIDIEVNVEK